jgi:uncharacterized protein (DUF4415 family)
MISDDPDEDADNLDDEGLIAACLGQGKAADPGDQAAGQDIPDWPPIHTRNVGLIVDNATVDWFKANHADWRQEMGFVLRAWVATKNAALTLASDSRG